MRGLGQVRILVHPCEDDLLYIFFLLKVKTSGNAVGHQSFRFQAKRDGRPEDGVGDLVNVRSSRVGSNFTVKTARRLGHGTRQQ